MTSTTFFFVFIPLLAFILLAINLIFAPHNPYSEKDSAFECGFHSFLGQNRTQFSISFFIFALLFLLFDLEILLVYPYIVSAYSNDMYGLLIMLIFFGVLTLGFAFELGKNALKIDSRQMYSVALKQSEVKSYYSNFAYILPLMKMDTLTNAFNSVIDNNSLNSYLVILFLLLLVICLLLIALSTLRTLASLPVPVLDTRNEAYVKNNKIKSRSVKRHKTTSIKLGDLDNEVLTSRGRALIQNGKKVYPQIIKNTSLNSDSNIKRCENHILYVRSVIGETLLIILNIGLIPLIMFIGLVCCEKSFFFAASITETLSLETLDYSFFNLFNNGFNLFISIYKKSDFIIERFFYCLYSNP